MEKTGVIDDEKILVWKIGVKNFGEKIIMKQLRN